jgi:hypothetical protein
MTVTEHILLESDSRDLPDVRSARTVHARLELRCRLRARVLQLEIIDYYYLSVRTRSRSHLREYVLDLRFIAPPRLTRYIAWRWILASLLLIAVPLTIAREFDLGAFSWWQRHWAATCLLIIGSWVFATVVAMYRTRETVIMFSVSGAAGLLEFTGGLGTFRRARPFLAKLAAHLRLASGARRRTRGEHLRDEMREHLRLREAKVLSAEQYELAKGRILGQHSTVPRSPVGTAAALIGA